MAAPANTCGRYLVGPSETVQTFQPGALKLDLATVKLNLVYENILFIYCFWCV